MQGKLALNFVDHNIVRNFGGFNFGVRWGQIKCCSYKFCTASHPLSSSLSLPSHARVVVCGAGVIGNSIAYHLVQNGWSDTVVLEQGIVGCGTSWHGSGLVGQFKSAPERTLVSYSAQLYKKLQGEGHDLGWKQCGSLNVARTRDRLTSLKRFVTNCRAGGLDCELISPSEIKKLHPHMNTGDLEGGVWLPSDGVVNSMNICLVLSTLAKQGGAEYVENCKVLQMLTTDGKVSAVETSLGTIQCDYVVNCTGLWSRDLGEKCDPKVRIPSHAAEHLYFTTKPLPSGTIDPMLPVIRDYDSRLYCREWNGGFLTGGFESVANAVFRKGIPESFQFQLLPQDFDHFRRLIDVAMKRVPILNKSEIEQLHDGPENFTADGKWILGESPEVDRYYVAVGMNGNSGQGAAGVGKALAEWIIEGEPTSDMLPFDIRRFTDLHNNKKFLVERVKEIAGRHYTLLYPIQTEFESARKLCCSPLYTEQEAEGAIFGEVMGFERALYFNTVNTERPAPGCQQSFSKPGWFDFVKDEYYTCREGVGVLDVSSMTKFKLKSPGTEVVDFLQLLCSNDINVPVGTIVQTGMQNEKGGFENDCVLLRQEENSFLMICPTVQHTRMTDWIHKHQPLDGSVTIHDITSMYTVLNLVGPKSRELMHELTNSDMNMTPFTYKEINMGYASGIMALGFTNMAEPGYSLYIPAEYALHIYDRLMTVGRDYGIRNVGYYSLRFLRIEKFIPFWGEELDSNTTPYEVGRGHKVKLEKEYFLGKFALMRQHEKGVTRRLVHFTLENHDVEQHLWPWGREPIFCNDKFVGTTTSAGYGFSVNKMVCMGFVSNVDDATGEAKIVSNDFVTGKQSRFEIEMAGERYPAKASLHPPQIPFITMDGMDTRYIPKTRSSVFIHHK